MDSSSSALEQALKVRKPYTITKQRERWTEEEHTKFLEALKLYGRAWRKIGEHIGTKTTVQIRSHAQKFFTKVTRESVTDGTCQAKTIEIPPPRPKRKPMHPYPRKLGNPTSVEKQEWSLIPKLSNHEDDAQAVPKLSLHGQENLSPTSVLSAVGSDEFGSSASELINGCMSMHSPAVGSDAAGNSSSEHENGCQSATTSVAEDEDKSSMRQDCDDMELDLGTDISLSRKEVSSEGAPASSLKLFGKTLAVARAQEPLLYSTGENAENCGPNLSSATDFEGHCESEAMSQLVQPQGQNAGDGVGAFPFSGGSFHLNSWPSAGTPMMYFLPPHGNMQDSAQGGPLAVPCMWAFYGGALPAVAMPSLSSEQHELSPEGDLPKESSAGSNTASASESSNEPSVRGGRSGAISMKLRHSETSAFTRVNVKVSADRPATAKGFVPYRRCVADEREGSKTMVNNSGEGQEVRLCL